jgi:hypothetical protein
MVNGLKARRNGSEKQWQVEIPTTSIIISGSLHEAERWKTVAEIIRALIPVTTAATSDPDAVSPADCGSSGS